MATENESTDTTEVKNPTALLAKNRDLLRKLSEAEAALQAAQEANSKLADGFYKVRITEPFEGIVREISPHPGLMAKTLKDWFDIRLDADNNPKLFNKQGEPLTWVKKSKDGDETVSVSLERASLLQWMINAFDDDKDNPAALLHKAQGTGALGGTHRVPMQPKSNSATVATNPTNPNQFGLR